MRKCTYDLEGYRFREVRNHFLEGFTSGRSLQSNKIRTGFTQGTLNELKEEPLLFKPSFSVLMTPNFAFFKNAKAILSYFRHERKKEIKQALPKAYAVLNIVKIAWASEADEKAFKGAVEADPHMGGRLMNLQKEGVLQHVTMQMLADQNQHAEKHKIDIRSNGDGS